MTFQNYSQTLLPILSLKPRMSHQGLRRFQGIFYTLDRVQLGSEQFSHSQVLGDFVATLPHYIQTEGQSGGGVI